MSDRERTPGEDLTPERLAAMSGEERFVHLGGWALAAPESVRGTYWRRNEPIGNDDPSDTIILSGFARVETAPETFADAIVIESATFGGIGDGWTGPKELLTYEEFANTYSLLTEGDREKLADDQAAASAKEDARLRKLSPEERAAEAQEKLKGVWS